MTALRHTHAHRHDEVEHEHPHEHPPGQAHEDPTAHDHHHDHDHNDHDHNDHDHHHGHDHHDAGGHGHSHGLIDRSIVRSRAGVTEVLAVMRDHPSDRLWQAWLEGQLLDRIKLVGTDTIIHGQRTYRRTHDCSVIVDDRSDPRTQTCQIFKIRDGQPVMPASLEQRLGEWQ